MIKIIIDTAGGDHSPDVNIDGAISALQKHEDLEIILIGRSELIEKKLSDRAFDKSRVSVIDAADEITCNDAPTVAIRTKTESSLVKAFELLKSNDDINALVSNGSTGAIIAGAVMKLGRIKGVKRPALCPVMPTMNGKLVAICDSGANVECDAVMLYQFGLMASLYMEKTFDVSSPRVALLNVGTEAEKGDALRKEVYKLLSENPRLNFVGNMESRDLLGGKYDIVVCDGFSGNVLCKATEGACLEMSKLVGGLLMKNQQAAALLKDDFMSLKAFMDYNNYGGAVLLGVKEAIVKAHGSCGATAISNSITQAYNMVKNGLSREIEAII